MKNLTPELIEKLDQYAPSPNANAQKVYEILKQHRPEIEVYDLYCFAVEMLAAGVVNGELKYAEGSIKLTAKDFYFAHYLRISECLTSDAAGIPKETISDGSSQISRGFLHLES